MTLDNPRFLLPWTINQMYKTNKNIDKNISGITVHWYGDIISSVNTFDAIHEKYPNKFLLMTEAYSGSFPEPTGHESSTNVLYALAHVREFVLAGSVRIKIDGFNLWVQSTAFKAPDDNIVILLHNPNMSTKYFSGRLTIFALLMIVTIIQGVQFDSNLSCQKFSTNGVCCPGRDEDCVVYASKQMPSSGGRCYCDEHCVDEIYPNQTDCCSDYEQYCKTPVNLKISTTKLPVQISSQNYSYEPKELNELIKSGLRHNSPFLSFMKRKLHESSTNLPEEYKILEKYLPEISGKWADESWAVTASEVLSNHFSMKYNLDKPIAMSTQQIISCSKTKQPDQFQKQPQDAWTFILKNNIVNESCYPLTGDNNKCQINFKTNNLTQCQNSNVYEPTELYKAREIYRVINASDVMNNEANIMTEIFKYGSVQATMKVYEDFINYKTGIYKQSPDALFMGYSSVIIIGWGEELNEKFWIAANSWGTSWGDNGYFKIAKGINSCAIEYYVVGVKV
ncbi:tubulointerstitial nephritis antigen-like [Aphidius gifuensis]|uniref:tubulointerstitial nephritis antigen-like n=1 Tax=Aphidius gifuensis TaxID=684658 RepID=UPI001CDC9282|nr:tubulointerstitial nephritis antigen-like [Aphidius gifuensis]